MCNIDISLKFEQVRCNTYLDNASYPWRLAQKSAEKTNQSQLATIKVLTAGATKVTLFGILRILVGRNLPEKRRNYLSL